MTRSHKVGRNESQNLAAPEGPFSLGKWGQAITPENQVDLGKVIMKWWFFAPYN